MEMRKNVYTILKPHQYVLRDLGFYEFAAKYMAPLTFTVAMALKIEAEKFHVDYMARIN